MLPLGNRDRAWPVARQAQPAAKAGLVGLAAETTKDKAAKVAPGLLAARDRLDDSHGHNAWSGLLLGRVAQGALHLAHLQGLPVKQRRAWPGRG